MNLSDEIIGGTLLTLFICVTLLIRYVFIGRSMMRNTQTRLSKIEEEVQSHPLNCPLKKQMEMQMEKQAVAFSAKKSFPLAAPLQSRLITAEEETSFRNLFASMHPDMLHRLRGISPKATRNDELLCMLILLKQNNEEISYLLGISRSSVLKNRYRLRCKLGLPEGVDLDAEVRRLLSSEEDTNIDSIH